MPPPTLHTTTLFPRLIADDASCSSGCTPPTAQVRRVDEQTSGQSHQSSSSSPAEVIPFVELLATVPVLLSFLAQADQGTLHVASKQLDQTLKTTDILQPYRLRFLHNVTAKGPAHWGLGDTVMDSWRLVLPRAAAPPAQLQRSSSRFCSSLNLLNLQVVNLQARNGFHAMNIHCFVRCLVDSIVEKRREILMSKKATSPAGSSAASPRVEDGERVGENVPQLPLQQQQDDEASTTLIDPATGLLCPCPDCSPELEVFSDDDEMTIEMEVVDDGYGKDKPNKNLDETSGTFPTAESSTSSSREQEQQQNLSSTSASPILAITATTSDQDQDRAGASSSSRGRSWSSGGTSTTFRPVVRACSPTNCTAGENGICNDAAAAPAGRSSEHRMLNQSETPWQSMTTRGAMKLLPNLQTLRIDIDAKYVKAWAATARPWKLKENEMRIFIETMLVSLVANSTWARGQRAAAAAGAPMSTTTSRQEQDTLDEHLNNPGRGGSKYVELSSSETPVWNGATGAGGGSNRSTMTVMIPADSGDFNPARHRAALSATTLEGGSSSAFKIKDRRVSAVSTSSPLSLSYLSIEDIAEPFSYESANLSSCFSTSASSMTSAGTMNSNSVRMTTPVSRPGTSTYYEGKIVTLPQY